MAPVAPVLHNFCFNQPSGIEFHALIILFCSFYYFPCHAALAYYRPYAAYAVAYGRDAVIVLFCNSISIDGFKRNAYVTVSGKPVLLPI